MTTIIAWLNTNSGFTSALAAIVTALATFVLAYITWRYVKLTAELVELQKPRPIVTVSPDEKPDPEIAARSESLSSKVLVVANNGNAPALNVRLHAVIPGDNPQLLAWPATDGDMLLCCLAPGRCVYLTMGFGSTVETLDVTVTYDAPDTPADQTEPAYAGEFTVDFRILKHIVETGPA